jgi:hypothetical protein
MIKQFSNNPIQGWMIMSESFTKGTPYESNISFHHFIYSLLHNPKLYELRWKN